MKEFRKKLLIHIGITLGILVLIIVFTAFAGSDISSRVTKIQTTKDTVAFQAKAIESLNALKDNAEKARPHLPFLNAILPLRDELIDFRRDMKNIATRHQLDFTAEFGTESNGNESSPGSISFQATLQGPLKNLIEFLADVRQSKYFVGFAGFDIGGDKDRYAIKTNGRVFFR